MSDKEQIEAAKALLRRSHSVIDKLMGDSDLPEDDSEEMKVCHAIVDFVDGTAPQNPPQFGNTPYE